MRHNRALWILRRLIAVWLLSVAPSLARGQPASAHRTETVATLENRFCRLELDARTGAIVSLRPGPPSLAGPWIEVVEEDRRGVATWETWERGDETIFSTGPAAVSADVIDEVARAHIVWQRPNGLTIEGQVELGAADAGPRFRVTVRNRTGESLVDTIRLLLRGAELDDAEDDWLTWPHTLGARFRVRGFAPGERLEHPYPAFLTMQWLDLHDGSQGVYLGCLDAYGYSKRLFIGRDDDGRSLMGVAFIGCWVAEKGDEWTTPWTQVAAHEGDWHAGARLYRPFAEAEFGPLDPPTRVRDMPTAQCWLGHHAKDANAGRLFEIQQQAPIHASYVMKSLNTSIPEGWDGFRGSALDLQDAFDRIRELGGSPALFTFDRAPLMGRPNYADYAGKWLCQRRDRSFCEGFRDMMPSPFDPDLVRARVGEAVRWVRDFGIDEIHYDTAATTSDGLADPSYHPGTPQRPNEVPHAFKHLYRVIRDDCRKHNPEFLLRAEHCADFFFPEFLTSTAHFFETANLVIGHNPPEDAQLMPILFRHTLPRHAALLMPSMSSDDFWTYSYGMGYGFHGGGPSWSFNPGVRQDESPPGELLSRYRFYDAVWRRYYDFRVGFLEATVDAERSDVIAEAEIDGQWRSCVFPGPVIAVTHAGGGREVTLGQWYHQSKTVHFAQRFVGDGALPPGPIRLRIPTEIEQPRVRLLTETGEAEAEALVRDGLVELAVQDPTCFAVVVSSGPEVRMVLAPLAQPGQPTQVSIHVEQPKPMPGTLTLHLPAGWQPLDSISVPAEPSFETTVQVDVPAGVFGRNYPVKAVLRTPEVKRTTAAHLKVMEPLTVLYGFNLPRAETVYCVDPGQPGHLTVTCINNTPEGAQLDIRVEGRQVSGRVTETLGGTPTSELGDPNAPLRQWIVGKGQQPASALRKSFEFDCTGVPREPVHITVRADDRTVFDKRVFPRTRLMSLNGDWKVSYARRSLAQVGGAERQDNLDTEALTPDVWDGNWETLPTPIRLDREARKTHSWAIYRRSVALPVDWRGADVQLRVENLGAPWGHGGTLNLVYVNGWPAGRIGASGECSVSPFLVFGGWNLIAIASMSPNSLIEPYLFVRDAPAPERLLPALPPPRPAGAFLTLGTRSTGQGLGMVHIRGVGEGDYRRTDVAKGGEHSFIYFTVADEFLRDPEGPVEIEVEYLDQKAGSFGLDYDSTDPAATGDGRFKSAPRCEYTGTGQWRTHTFHLTDARLANGQHQGADFRLYGDAEQDLCVRRVAVRSAP